MPLINSGSKKAFQKNVKTEMKSDRPRAQDLAIAYNIKRKNSKKMAAGGIVDESARSERRPMPNERDQDSKMVSHNSSNKPAKEDSWTSRPDMKQSTKGMQTTHIKHPKMVPSSSFSTRLRDQEDDLQQSAKVNNGPQIQPPEDDNEMDANKQGHDLMDKSSPHSKNLNRYAKGGMINEEVSMNDAEEDEVQHPKGLESDNDEKSPAEDEYMAGHFAEGGEVDDMNQPEDEAKMDHHNSIAAAIMAKKERQKRLASGSTDEDLAAMMADGGMVDIDENAEEQPNGYYERNEHAALKENYDSDMDDMHQPEDSNEHADSREDESENKHDMISSIRSKMKRQRQF